MKDGKLDICLAPVMKDILFKWRRQMSSAGVSTDHDMKLPVGDR